MTDIKWLKELEKVIDNNEDNSFHLFRIIRKLKTLQIIIGKQVTISKFIDSLDFDSKAID